MNLALATRTAPISGATPAQTRARLTLGGLNQAYRALPMTKKGTWQQAANLLNTQQRRAGHTRLSPSNTYVALNSALLSIGQPALDNAPTILTAPPLLPQITLTAASNFGELTPANFTLTLAASAPYACSILIQAAPQAPAGKPTFPDHSFKTIGSIASLSTTPTDIAALYQATYGPPEPGAQIALKLTPISQSGLRLPPLLLTTVITPPKTRPLAIPPNRMYNSTNIAASDTTSPRPNQRKHVQCNSHARPPQFGPSRPRRAAGGARLTMERIPNSLWTVYDGWDGCQASLAHAVAPLTPAQLAWRPARDLRSVGEVAEHISLGRVGWFQRMDAPTSAALAAKLPAVGSVAGDPAQLVAWLEKTWAMIDATLSAWTIADLSKTYEHTYWGKTYAVSRQWTIWRIMAHDIHHGGQLSMMLMSQGIAIPELGDFGGHLTEPPLAD